MRTDSCKICVYLLARLQTRNTLMSKKNKSTAMTVAKDGIAYSVCKELSQNILFTCKVYIYTKQWFVHTCALREQGDV